jgi:hypothetical protein
MPEVTVSESGPLFGGLRDRITDQHLTRLREDLAQEAVNRIHQRLHEVLQHPTGRYESSIQTERQVADLAVTDGGIIYGNWLEGTGSRNYPATRFRGYHTFRDIGQQVEAMAGPYAEQQLASYVAELNALQEDSNVSTVRTAQGTVPSDVHLRGLRGRRRPAFRDAGMPRLLRSRLHRAPRRSHGPARGPGGLRAEVMLGKCLQCLIDLKLADQEGNGASPGPETANEAITLAPSWQGQQVGPQQLMACIPVPTCYDHLMVARTSPLAKGVLLDRPR